jgi:hypothetical protein
MALEAMMDVTFSVATRGEEVWLLRRLSMEDVSHLFGEREHGREEAHGVLGEGLGGVGIYPGHRHVDAEGEGGVLVHLVVDQGEWFGCKVWRRIWA